ncbi:MAG: hypothetical protein IKG67_01305 [Parasporobacterium sp.]|nr:hypothetical protein [Parasporobacterium sp.]
MKAVVLEIKNGYAAVLREDGVVVKIKRRCEVGETIFLSGKEAEGIRQSSYARMIRNIAIAAAVVLIVLGGSSTYYLTATSAATVEVDAGDTRVMLSVNHFNRVIGISSGQEEDAELISAIDAEGIRNNTLEEALQKASAVIRGRNGTSAEESAEQAAQITIRTANDATYEQLRGQAEKGGYSVKRKEDTDESRSGHNEPEISAVPIEENTVPEAHMDMDVNEDMDRHAGAAQNAGVDGRAEDVHADAEAKDGMDEHTDMNAETYETDRQEQMEHRQGTGENGMSEEDANSRNEMAEGREGEFVPGQAQEGESHEQMQEGENPKPAQEGESPGQETGNDMVQKMDPGDSLGDRGEGPGMRP